MCGAEHATKFGVTLPAIPPRSGFLRTGRRLPLTIHLAPRSRLGNHCSEPACGGGRHRDPFSLFGLLETSAHLGTLERNHHWRIASRSLQAHLTALERYRDAIAGVLQERGQPWACTAVGSISKMILTWPGWAQGYLSFPRYFFARKLMCADAPSSVT